MRSFAALRMTESRHRHRHTLKIRAYLALISSAIFSTSAGSSRKVLIEASGGRPALALTCWLAGYWPLRVTMNCWPSADMIQANISRPALGLGADLNTAMGLEICGVPSTAYTTSIGAPRSLAIQN